MLSHTSATPPGRLRRPAPVCWLGDDARFAGACTPILDLNDTRTHTEPTERARARHSLNPHERLARPQRRRLARHP